MRKSLLLPLLIPLLLFAAVKGFFWYQVKRFTDQLVEQAAPFASIEYDAIETSFDGVAGLSGIRIYPLGHNDAVRIASLRVLSDDWLFFLKLGTPLDKGDLPDTLALEVNGLAVNLDTGIADAFMQGSMPVSDPAPGCEKSQLQGMALMRRLGYDAMISDLRFAYRFSPESEYLNISLDSATRDSFRLLLEADVDLGVSSLNRQRLSQSSPKLGGVSLSYWDESYNSRWVEYCAGLNEQSPADFINTHVQLAADQLRAMGLRFDDVLVDAYQRFLSGNGQAKLSMHAEQAMGMEALVGGPPTELLKAWTLSLEVDSAPVSGFDLGWESPALARSAPSVEAPPIFADDAAESVPAESQQPSVNPGPSPAEVDVEPEPVVVETAEPVEPVEKYRVTGLSELHRYIGSDILVSTLNGRRIEGQVIGLSDAGMELRRRMGSGVVIMPVAFAHVLELKVKR